MRGFHSFKDWMEARYKWLMLVAMGLELAMLFMLVVMEGGALWLAISKR